MNFKRLFAAIAALIMVTFMAQAQIKVNSDGNVGIGDVDPKRTLHIKGDKPTIRIQNSDDYNWEIRNAATNIWGHTNTLTFRASDNYPVMWLNPDREMYMNGDLIFGVGGCVLKRGETGQARQAKDYDFNTNSSYGGMLLENRYNESSGFYSDRDFAVIWSSGDYGYLLKVLDEDYMSNSSDELKWYIDGSGNAYTNSDARKKENVEEIYSPLSKIKQLRGVSYDFILTENETLKNDSILNGTKSVECSNIEDYKKKFTKKDCGFIAQELEEVIPEVVQTDEAGYKFVNYDGVIPFLVEAMKEQQEMIEEQQETINEQQSTIDELTNRITDLESQKDSESVKSNRSATVTTGLETSDAVSEAVLYQNNPNPFTESTEINYYLPETANNTQLIIYNMNGIQLKNISISQTGNGSVVISANEFQPGIYIYTMIVDNKALDTKQMILTE